MATGSTIAAGSVIAPISELFWLTEADAPTGKMLSVIAKIWMSSRPSRKIGIE